jgi:hypothetical protein
MTLAVNQEERALSRLAKWLRSHGMAIALVPLFWLALLAPPDQVGGLTLDDSWEQGLAILLRSGAQIGRDYIFTSGPLGYFLTTSFDSDLFWHKFVYEAVVKLVMAGVFATALVRMPSRAGQVLFGVLVLTCLGPADRIFRDTTYAIFLLAFTVLAFDRPTNSFAGYLYLASLVVISQLKFTLFILCSICLVVRVGSMLTAGRFRDGLATLFLFALGWLVIWFTLGQSPLNIPAYFYGSWQIATGYADAMELTGPERWPEVALALAIFTCLGTNWWLLQRERKWRFLPLWLGLAASIFLMWKQGFTRHDGPHALSFFSYTLVVPLIASLRIRARSGRNWVSKLLAAAVLLFSAAGMLLAAYPNRPLPLLAKNNLSALQSNGVYLLTPWRLLRSLEALRSHYGDIDWRLPRIKSRVQNASVDLISYPQAFLFANEMNWRPRPVFQSYSAYTPYLQQANADFLRSTNSPEFLMLAPNTIDDHLPTSEDALAFLEVLKRYHPVLIEKGFLLVQRGALPEPHDPRNHDQVLAMRTVGFGEAFSLPDGGTGYQTIAIDVRPSWQGRLRSILYKPAPLYIDLTTTGGRRLQYRLDRLMVQGEVLINPLLENGSNLTDLLHLYGLPGAARVATLRIRAAEGAEGDYDPQIHLTLRFWPGPSSAPLTPAAVKRLLESGH